MALRANPLRIIRKANGLTQKQVAIGAGITSQVVLKAEQGLYGLIPPRLLSSVAEIGGVREEELETAYFDWQREKRFENRELILGNLGRAGIDCGTYKEFRTAVGGSILGFCKLLCLHPAQWSRLEKSGGEREFFEKAMKEAELEWLLIHLA